jgi:hypothetical protein
MTLGGLAVTDTGVKKMLRALAKASKGAWEGLGATVFAGEATLSTAHTSYELVDGVCRSFTKAGARRTGGGTVGMRLVGWLHWQDGQAAIDTEFRAGASAVLWKPGFAGGSIALTSPSVGWCRPMPAPPGSAPVPRAPDSGILRRGPGLGIRRPAMDSLTRIHTRR